MFPGPHAHVYYNEAGEPLGWDNEYSFEPPEPSEEDERRWDAEAAFMEELWEEAKEYQEEATGEDTDEFAEWRSSRTNKAQWETSVEEAWFNFLAYKERQDCPFCGGVGYTMVGDLQILCPDAHHAGPAGVPRDH